MSGWILPRCRWRFLAVLGASLSIAWLVSPAALNAAQEQPAHEESAHEESAETHEAPAGAAEHGEGEEHAADEHAGGAHGHDPLDLTHANATAGLSKPSEMRFDQVLASWIVFFALMLLVGKLGWQPIMKGLEKREEGIAHKIAEAERNAATATERLQAYEAKLAAAAEEARGIVAQAHKEAEATAQRIVNEAQEAAQRERNRALADIEGAKNSALDGITQRSVDLAVAMASRIVRRQLSVADQQQLIQEALEQFPSRN